MCVTDAWKLYKYHLPERHRHKRISIVDFADLVCKDMLENPYERSVDDRALSYVQAPPLEPRQETIRQQQAIVETVQGVGEISTLDEQTVETAISSLTRSTFSESNVMAKHILCRSSDKESCTVVMYQENNKKRKGERTKRGICVICDLRRKTMYYCRTCTEMKLVRGRYWVCPADDLRTGCQEAHVKKAVADARLHFQSTHQC